MILTIDPYYSTPEYRVAINALKNNSINYSEFIMTKTPYNWYVKLEEVPSMTNFDILPKAQEKFIVNVVKPARPNEEYLLQRRDNDMGETAMKKFVLNAPLKEADESEYSCFFNIKSKDELQRISKSLPGTKLYYFGKYYSGKFRVVLCNNKMIRNFVLLEDILAEKTPATSVIQMELDLNFRVFNLRDRLQKFTETGYMLDGLWNPAKIQNVKISF